MSVVIGSVLALASAGLLTGGAGVLWAQTQRQDGYLTSAPRTYSTHGYALATESIGLHAGGWDWVGQVLGKVRIRVTWPGTAKPLFLGIAPTAAATGYLSGVPYTTVTDLGGNAATISHPGTGTPRAPQLARIWSAQVSGGGTQALTWTAREGDWMVVVMNRDRATGPDRASRRGRHGPGPALDRGQPAGRRRAARRGRRAADRAAGAPGVSTPVTRLSTSGTPVPTQPAEVKDAW